MLISRVHVRVALLGGVDIRRLVLAVAEPSRDTEHDVSVGGSGPRGSCQPTPRRGGRCPTPGSECRRCPPRSAMQPALPRRSSWWRSAGCRGKVGCRGQLAAGSWPDSAYLVSRTGVAGEHANLRARRAPGDGSRDSDRSRRRHFRGGERARTGSILNKKRMVKPVSDWSKTSRFLPFSRRCSHLRLLSLRTCSV